MNIRGQTMKSKPKSISGKLIVPIAIALLLIGTVYQPVLAQNKKQENKQNRQRNRAQLFVDEDGDGFNDNLPDFDGDGIPNMIDPDFKGHSAESLYMCRYMYGQTIEAERNRYQQNYQHGESGQYGPNDSTGHGQGDGRGGHQGNSDSGNEGSGGGQDGQGGSGGQSGGNQVGGAGLKSTGTADQQQQGKVGATQDKNSQRTGRAGSANNRSISGNNRNSETKTDNDSDSQGGKGRR